MLDARRGFPMDTRTALPLDRHDERKAAPLPSKELEEERRQSFVVIIEFFDPHPHYNMVIS